MPLDIIKKSPSGWCITPNLIDYNEAQASFSWKDAKSYLDGLPGGDGLNIAHETIDRHAKGPRGKRVALRWLDSSGKPHDYTYFQLRDLTNRFANALCGLEIGKGDQVSVLAPRIPELYIAALGTLKNGSVFCSLFSAFGPEPIRTRLNIGRTKVLVTTETLYRRKIKRLRNSLPDLEQVLIIGNDREPSELADTLDFHQLLEAADAQFTIPPTDPEDIALLHFTSGTTGMPKGAIHVHGAVTMHNITARLALDLHPNDIFWCTADPGWVTGISYGIIAPLTTGATVIVDSEEFDAERWYRILQEQKVSVWYTTPTSVRMMMRMGTGLAARYKTDSLRFLASVGEPLNPEAIVWGERVFGLPIHDNWWQTETGGIMISNYLTMDIKLGSMGRPMPGIEARIVRRMKNGSIEIIEEPNALGELALRIGWPSMFRGYLGEEERYKKCFAGDWYVTGDLARQDADGYFWFVGRTDDMIKSAGHLIGPFEVESVLMENPAVAEAGVIGKPDPLVKEVVKAFVVLKPGYEANDALEKELLGHARKRLGAAVAPREIGFRRHLPKTRSGKIMRRLLEAKELGLPEGDISALETRLMERF